MKVKGTVIIDLVRSIKGKPDFDWSVYLEPEDFAILNSIVIASKWYDGGFFWRASFAVGEVFAKHDLSASFEFGRQCANSYLAVYKRLMLPGEPMKTLEGFIKCWESFYDVEGRPFRPMEIKGEQNGATIRAWDYPDMKPAGVRPRFFHGLAGYFQEIAEQSSSRPVVHTLADRGDHFVMTYRW